MNDKTDTFASRLQQIIIERGIKKIELSRLTDIPPSQITAYLKGFYQPKRDTLKKLSIALNVSELWLMGYDEKQEIEIETKDIMLDDRMKAYIDFVSRMTESDRESVYKYIDFLRHNSPTERKEKTE